MVVALVVGQIQATAGVEVVVVIQTQAVVGMEVAMAALTQATLAAARAATGDQVILMEVLVVAVTPAQTMLVLAL